jgi:transcriptional regulator with XRE-family HTH domain
MSKTGAMSLNEFLEGTFSQEFLDEAKLEYALAEVAGKVFRVKEESGLSVRKIAQKMGSKSPAIVQRLIDQDKPHNVTLSTLIRFAFACGHKLVLDFKPSAALSDWKMQNVWEDAPVVAETTEKKKESYQIARAARRPRLECPRNLDFLGSPDGTDMRLAAKRTQVASYLVQ